MKSRVFGAAGALALQLTLVLVMLFAVAFDRGFYSREYETLGVYESCGAERETLEHATDIVLDYLRGDTDDMSGAGVIDGQQREIFGMDERMHMADVKQLFQLALIVLLVSGAAAIACMLLAGRLRRETAQGALLGIGVFIAALGAMALWFAADFGGAFTAFHHLLFNNGLWLMDPRTQFMIRMFPQQFFADMGLRLAIFTGTGILMEIFVVCMAGFCGRKE